jgi:two-component system NtrC family sensor kinase
MQVPLNALVAETLELLAYPLQIDNIEIYLHPADDLPPLWADPNQLRQVLINLVSNAHQALRETPPPRQLTLSTHTDAARAHVMFTVDDTGPGIPLDIQTRIFEPFFTTKPLGVGTGLGLSLCRGIIEAHGGIIRVQSRPGHGASFLVALPVEAAPMSVPAPSTPSEIVPRHGKSILVVDDEAGIRSALAHLLRRDGHRVETAANGRLALIQIQEKAFDLILCDLRMPQLDGPGLYRELEARQPHLLRHMIFLTGDTLSAETKKFLDGIDTPRLTKPFTVAEARRVVEQALQAAQGSE